MVKLILEIFVNALFAGPGVDFWLVRLNQMHVQTETKLVGGSWQLWQGQWNDSVKIQLWLVALASPFYTHDPLYLICMQIDRYTRDIMYVSNTGF